MNVQIRAHFRLLAPFLFLASWLLLALPASAQNRFMLRAEPDVIAANGISTTSIFVQVPQDRSAIQASPMVRFATTAGVIETQAQLTGGVARVLLRSSTTPGTATVTAFIGNSREAITVEFSEDNGLARRYLEVSAPYVAYGSDSSLITASGKTGLDFGDTHIESDVRLDVDLSNERVWAQGTKGSVLIRHGRGAKVKILRGDRLFYDLRRNRGVMRRAEGNSNAETARQEFVGNDFAAPPTPSENDKEAEAKKAAGTDIPANPNDPVVKPPLAPSPSLQLEDGANRGSTFVVPSTVPPTAAPDDRGETGPIAAPEVIGGVGKEKTEEVKTEDAKAEDAKDAKPDEKSGEGSAPQISQFGDLNAQINGTGGPSTVAPGSLADTPKAPEDSESRATALVAVPRPGEAIGELKAGNPPAYSALPAGGDIAPLIVELPPPTLNVERGYWVASRRLRVFPRDKVQFERASIYFNGKKAFGLPLYVLPLDGSFNPTTDMLSFNSQGGAALKFPFYYQASKVGTGAVYLNRDQGNGFSTQRSGFSLSLDQQYWISPNSHGKMSLDQLGRGAWNLNYQHEMQFSPNTTGSFYLNMPRHRDMFARASLAKELKALQVGFEAFYDNPETTDANLRGQFFARSRPKAVGKTGWSYTMSANALAVKRGITNTLTVGGGGGVNIPGGTPGRTITTTRPLFGQTLTASMQSPVYSPWRGSAFTANLLSTAFNYSNGRRGLAPGITMGLSQSLGKADLRVDYTYDRSNLGLYGLTSESFTNYVSATVAAQLTKKVGFSSFLSQSLNDGSLYGSADLSYYVNKQWRTGVFTDYSNFSNLDSLFNYGWSIGRSIGAREISINYDANRGRVYLELGNSRY
jgi:hypothetical protein